MTYVQFQDYTHAVPTFGTFRFVASTNFRISGISPDLDLDINCCLIARFIRISTTLAMLLLLNDTALEFLGPTSRNVLFLFRLKRALMNFMEREPSVLVGPCSGKFGRRLRSYN